MKTGVNGQIWWRDYLLTEPIQPFYCQQNSRRYREALLGFPPESISAHQIPEGDMIAGFLGEANTTPPPVDAGISCGTAFGGTW